MNISNKTLKVMGFKKDPDHNSFFLTKTSSITIVICRDPSNLGDGIIFTVIGEDHYKALKLMKAKEYIKAITIYPRASLNLQTLSETINTINENITIL